MDEKSRDGDDAGFGRAFSIPAYIGACATGGVSLAVLVWSTMVVASLLSPSPEAGLLIAPPFLVLAVLIGAVAAVPATLVFLPTTLAGLYFIGRYRLTRRWHYAGFGALSSMPAGVLLTILLPPASAFGASIWFFVVYFSEFAIAGALAGLVYRRLELTSRPNHKAAN